jgi:hypothetical protein
MGAILTEVPADILRTCRNPKALIWASSSYINCRLNNHWIQQASSTKATGELKAMRCTMFR